MSRNPDLIFITEYIKNVLYFAVFKPGRVPVNCSKTHYFCIDDDLIYESYYLDFGPLNISCVYKYCKLLNDKINLHSHKQVLIHYTTTDAIKTANAAFLMACFGVLYLSMSADKAFKPLLQGQYMPFQDACPQKSPYTITILDCLKALVKARDFNFFNFQDFNVAEYIKLDKLQGGDLNWIVPGKFLAFIGPVDNTYSAYNPPEMYVRYFTQNNVKVVIRLNKKLYDSNTFTRNGILHYDLFFPDGSCPQKHIVMKFLEISEDTTGAIAVHCKAGLGRTGTLIGSYLIKHYRMTAHEAIAWMRICRPGSVIGHQQEWLEKIEEWLLKQGNIYRRRIFQDVNRFPKHEFGIYSFFKTRYLSRPMVHKSPSPLSSRKLSPSEPSSACTTALRPSISRRKDGDAQIKTENEKCKLHQKSFYQNQTIAINKEKSHYFNATGNIPWKMKSGDDCETRKSRPASRSSKHIKPEFVRNDDKANKIYQHSRVNQNTQSQLQSFIKISRPPQYRFTEYKYEPKDTFNVFEKERKQPLQPEFRSPRRLGRSPSPPVTRKINEETRPIKTRKHKFCVEKKASKPKVSSHRRCSAGAVSLDAQRSAPIDHRASSVRSDERQIATQGDLLNSIKYSRRLKESLKADHHLKTMDKGSDEATKQQGGLANSSNRSDSPKIRRPFLINLY